MKIKINRNILWAETFVNELTNLGIKYACLSPGSRNTALTIAFSQNKKIKSFVIIDERSSAFFGLGLAKASNFPVVLVSTSGTATAEFYPAIIEAYQYHVPLIICTADRPPELLNSGANQTINQDNIYRNHINWFFNVGLPEPTEKQLKELLIITRRAFSESMLKKKGPVHLNFPFRKPFEPFSYTDEVDDSLIQFSTSGKELNNKIQSIPLGNSISQRDFSALYNLLKIVRKGIIVAGPDDEKGDFPKLCNQLASILKYPIIADGISQLRFGGHSKKNILSSFEGILRAKNLIEKFQPELILQFGKTPTSKGLELFFENSFAIKYLVNTTGDRYDPTNKAKAALGIPPADFCNLVIQKLKQDKFENKDSSWLNIFLNAESLASKIKNKMIDNASFPFEGRIINEVIQLMPNDSSLMISNSMPVRDLDYFAPKLKKSILIFNNRGASGIDGITSTALGISEHRHKPTVLITGDLAFYYDLNGLLTSKKYKIPLVVVLINNDGGGIFEMLPISDYQKIFKEYFITPHGLSFSPFVKSYGGKFTKIKNWNHFQSEFLKAIKIKNLSVLQIKTDAHKSAVQRKKFWEIVGNTLTNDKM